MVSGSGFSFSPVTNITIGANSNVSRAELEAMLDERDGALYESFSERARYAMANPRR
jgi:hypothetical protein